MPKARKTPFSAGREWRCERDLDPFTFVILGDSEERPGQKRCLVRYDPSHIAIRWNEPRLTPHESVFTRDHLKKVAYLLSEEQAEEASQIRAEMDELKGRFIELIRGRGEANPDETEREEWDLVERWTSLRERMLAALRRRA